MSSRIDGNVYIAGQLTVNAFNPPDGCVGDNQMNPSSPIGVDKVRHLFAKCHSQVDGGSVFNETVIIHIALSPGIVEQFQAGLRIANIGDTTLTVDLKKNGSSILSDIIDIDSSLAAYAQVVAGIDPTKMNYAIGDVFEVVTTVTDGTGTPGQGLFAQVAFDEGAF